MFEHEPTDLHRSRATQEFEAPRYGQAAAIFLMYQAELLEREKAKPPPRRPTRGLLASFFDSIRPYFRVPAPVYVRV